MQPGPYAHPVPYSAAPTAVDPNAPFAGIHHLGAPRSEHPGSGASKWVGVVLGVLSLLGAVGAVIAGGLSVLEELSRRRPNIGDALVGPAIAIAICLPLAALFFWLAWRNWRRAAALYEGGFALFDHKGLKVVRWDDIESVYQSIVRQYVNGVYTGTYYTYTVIPRGGQKLVLDNRLRDVEHLGGAVVQAAAAALLPRYIHALQSGQRLSFGPLALDRQGLYTGSKSLAWGEIKAIKLDQGVLSVAKEGKWLKWTSATVPQIPNFHVMMTLLGSLTTVE